MLMIRAVSNHIYGRLSASLLKFLYSRVPDYKPGLVGKIKFYGSPHFTMECVISLSETLPNYDKDLAVLFRDGKAELTFFSDDRYKVSYPTAAVYVIPQHIWKHGPEGICQYIVYSYIRTSLYGVGIGAAFRASFKLKYTSKQSKEKMIAWLQEKKYPSGWIKCYQ